MRAPRDAGTTDQVTRPPAGDRLPLPSPRGPLTAALLTTLVGDPGPVDLRSATRRTTTDAVLDDDLQLALFLLYELHYRGLEGVDDRWEWAPDLLRLRGELEDDGSRRRWPTGWATGPRSRPRTSSRRCWTTSPAPTPAVG